MKIDTKKATAISSSQGHGYLTGNKFIPSFLFNHCGDATPGHANSGGRQVFYEPTIVYQPVYASGRLHDLPGQKRFLTDDGMDELNDKLNALLLHDNDADEEDESPSTKDNETKTTCQRTTFSLSWLGMLTAAVSSTKDNSKDVPSNMGRVPTTAVSSKTKQPVLVLRSARIGGNKKSYF